LICVKGHSLSSIIHLDFTEDQQLMSVYIYILMTYLNGIDQLQGE